MNDHVTSHDHAHPIVFFDGVCGLCDLFVTFLLHNDRHHVLRFAPLQGVAAQTFLGRGATQNLTTVILWSDHKVFTHSEAAIRAVLLLGGPWRLLKVLLWIPRPIRDLLYRFIAARRYQIFGRKESCRVPSAAEKAYFLD